MSNAASLFLPGSNLTNLIVLHGEHVSGATFLARSGPPRSRRSRRPRSSLLVVFWRALARRAVARRTSGPRAARPRARAAVGVVAVLVLALASPALPVLAVGVAAVLARRAPPAHAHRGRRRPARARRPVRRWPCASARVGRWWTARRTLLDSLGRWQTAAIRRGRCDRVNNLPASVLLTPHPPAARAGAPARAQPRPEPRRHRLALGVPLAARRARHSGRSPSRAHLLAARRSCSCRSRSPRRSRRCAV